MNYLLHTENFALIPGRGGLIKKQLEKRAAEVLKVTKNRVDPDVSVLIRSKNELADITVLLADIEAQVYSGRVEVIVVDTESTDGTAEYAEAHGAKVISISQAEFTYPKALNIGFKAAKYPYVAV